MRLTLHFILTLSFLSFLESAITKFEGENVTFQPNITGLQINSYYWNVTQNNLTEKIITEKIIDVTKNTTTIQRTRFKGRLVTDNITGSITISNLTVYDAGTFQGFFFRNWENVSYHIDELEVKGSDDYIELDIMVGSNVTLSSKLQRLEEDHVISWFYGKQFHEREIANSRRRPSKHGDPFDNVFLNLTNGDLKIPQITKSFHGKYHLRIRKHGYPFSSGIYDVRVYDHVSVPNISKPTDPPTNSSCRVTCSVENGPEVNLTWFRGNISISHINISNQNDSILRLPLHIGSEDSSTYRCQAQNPVSMERKTLDSQQLTCQDAGSAKLSVVSLSVVVTLVIIGVGICLYIYRRTRERGSHVGDPQRSRLNQQTSPQTADGSSLTSEDFLLKSCQGSSYDTVN